MYCLPPSVNGELGENLGGCIPGASVWAATCRPHGVGGVPAQPALRQPVPASLCPRARRRGAAWQVPAQVFRAFRWPFDRVWRGASSLKSFMPSWCSQSVFNQGMVIRSQENASPVPAVMSGVWAAVVNRRRRRVQPAGPAHTLPRQLSYRAREIFSKFLGSKATTPVNIDSQAQLADDILSAPHPDMFKEQQLQVTAPGGTEDGVLEGRSHRHQPPAGSVAGPPALGSISGPGLSRAWSRKAQHRVPVCWLLSVHDHRFVGIDTHRSIGVWVFSALGHHGNEKCVWDLVSEPVSMQTHC